MTGLLRAWGSGAVLVVMVGLVSCSSSADSPPADQAPAASQAAEVGASQSGAEPGCLTQDRAFVAMAATRSDLAGVRARDDLIGQAVKTVEVAEREQGHPIRVLAEDGSCRGRRENLQVDRTNLYVQGGRIIWAAMF